MAMAYQKFGILPSDYEKQNADKMRQINEIIDTINSRKSQITVNKAAIDKMIGGR